MGDAGAPQPGAIEHHVDRGAQRRSRTQSPPRSPERIDSARAAAEQVVPAMQGLGVEPRPWPNGQSISCPAAVDAAAVVAVDAAFAAASAAAAADVAAVAVMGPTRTGSDIQTARIA